MSMAANSLITLIGTGVTAVLSIVFVSLGARWLGPAEYGEVGAVLSVANVLFLLLVPFEAGLTLHFAGLAGQARFSDLRGSARRSLLGTLAVATSLLLLWLAGCALLSFTTGIDTGAFAWLGVFFCAALACNIPRAVLRGREMFGALSTNFVLEGVVRVALGLGLIHLQGRASSMIAAYGIAALLALVHAGFCMSSGLPNSPPADDDREEPWLPLQSYSTPLLLVHAYSALMLNLDVLAAKHFLAPIDAGLYAGASSITRIVSVAASPLVLVLFSRLASLHAAGASTRKTALIGASVIVGSSALSLLVPSFFGESVLRTFLGADFVPAHPILIYQWVTACVLVAQSLVADTLLATLRLRGAWLLLAPASTLPLALAVWHHSPLVIAQITLGACATVGTVVHVVIWRARPAALP